VNTRRRTKILSQCSMESLSKWVEQIRETGEVKILKGPKMGLVMMRAKDTVALEVFNLGEVLVSDCTASVDGQLGYGVVLGNEPERAEAMAILDALFHSKGAKWEELLFNINSWLEEQEQLQQKELQKEFNLIKRTRVNFEVMESTMGDEVDGE